MSYRYIGNKTKLVPWVLAKIRSLAPKGSTVADPMCGTASVSEALRTAGYRVIASDIMTFSVHHARVRLLLDSPPIFSKLGSKNYIDILSELSGLEPIEGHIFREYCPSGNPASDCPPRKYFTSENAKKIDAINLRLTDWERGKLLEPFESSLLRHDLIHAANKVANIAGTYGHFRSEWSNGSRAPINLKPSEILLGHPNNHVVMQGPVEDIAELIKADLCYLDPPYMKRQYAANYHLIETLARGDHPEAVGLSGLRPWRDQYSNFCSKVRIRNSFREVFTKMDCPHFLISYNEDGLLSVPDLIELFEEFGRVSIDKTNVQRFRSNNSPLGNEVIEYLFHLNRT